MNDIYGTRITRSVAYWRAVRDRRRRRRKLLGRIGELLAPLLLVSGMIAAAYAVSIITI